ncbi:MAG TPA: hypothetical protein VFX20_20300 [Steroidobacteraceae bacterium]|nr:hypothetical protein [Steroidobacteraceae bacterium]
MNKLLISVAFCCLVSGCTFHASADSSGYVPSGLVSVAVQSDKSHGGEGDCTRPRAYRVRADGIA